jgi:predicted small secreted protein
VKTSALIAAAVLGLSFGIAGCDTKDSPGDHIKDGLDVREHEGAKDAVEDVREGAHDAKEDAKRKVKDATD